MGPPIEALVCCASAFPRGGIAFDVSEEKPDVQNTKRPTQAIWIGRQCPAAQSLCRDILQSSQNGKGPRMQLLTQWASLPEGGTTVYLMLLRQSYIASDVPKKQNPCFWVVTWVHPQEYGLKCLRNAHLLNRNEQNLFTRSPSIPMQRSDHTRPIRDCHRATLPAHQNS